jgi:hypothetical protein
MDWRRLAAQHNKISDDWRERLLFCRLSRPHAVLCWFASVERLTPFLFFALGSQTFFLFFIPAVSFAFV